MHELYLSDEEFLGIYGRVPRLNVDLIIRSEEGILLTLRSIEPYMNLWHIPGGTVYKGEKIIEAGSRIAQNETGLKVNFKKTLGYMEFPHETRFGASMHTVSIVLEFMATGGALTPNAMASRMEYFTELPDKIVPEHRDFLKENNIFS